MVSSVGVATSHQQETEPSWFSRVTSTSVPSVPAGRCIQQILTCNRQNDCGDNSDERDCVDFKTVCPAEKRVAPGSDLLGNGWVKVKGSQLSSFQHHSS